MIISGFNGSDEQYINGIYGNTASGIYGKTGAAESVQGAQAQAANAVPDAGGVQGTEKLSSAQLKALKRSGAVECSTCASRKYQDGSNEGDVSYKAPGHIDPSQSAGRVMAHELEHVGNAVEKASKKDATLMSANVTLKTAICPECGRSYVAGGVTHTAIKYSDDSYSQNKKSLDYQAVAGANVDEAV